MFSRFNQRLMRYAEKDGRGYPDWAMRYAPVVRRLRSRLHPGIRILEIGANENGFARFVKKSGTVPSEQPEGARRDCPRFFLSLLALDISMAHLHAARAAQPVRPVNGDAARLPFPDHTFDCCVCLDTFEHLHPEQRAAVAEEIVRVLKPDGIAVAGFPSGAGALQAEQRIQDAYRHLTGRTIPWLDEHAAMGLPDAEIVAAEFRRAAGPRYSVLVEGNTPLWLWEWMWRILMCQWPGRGNALFQAALRWMMPVLPHCHCGACYRTLVWVVPESTHRLPCAGFCL